MRTSTIAFGLAAYSSSEDYNIDFPPIFKLEIKLVVLRCGLNYFRIAYCGKTTRSYKYNTSHTKEERDRFDLYKTLGWLLDVCIGSGTSLGVKAQRESFAECFTGRGSSAGADIP